MKSYQKYLLSESEEFAQKTLTDALVSAKLEAGDTNESGRVVRIPQPSGSSADSSRNLERAHHLCGMTFMLACLREDPSLVSFMSGHHFGLMKIKGSLDDRICEHMGSPRLCREKMRDATPRELAKALADLYDDQEAWTQGYTEDVGHLFD